MHRSASLHVTCKPHCAIIQLSITVFIATVFPPVFGPVMIMPLVSPPILNCSGILVALSIRGWRASFKEIRRPVFIDGSVAPRSILSLPFENIKSSFSIMEIFSSITAVTSATTAVSVYRIRYISFSSPTRSCCNCS